MNSFCDVCYVVGDRLLETHFFQMEVFGQLEEANGEIANTAFSSEFQVNKYR